MAATRRDYYHVDGAPEASAIVPAASAIVVSGDRVLLHRRRDSGQWSLPGGAMHLGETIAATCAREVEEETGLRVEVVGLVGVYTDPCHVIAYSDGEVRQQFSVCFLCSVVNGELRLSSESIDLRWFELKSLPEELPPAQLQRIQDYVSGSCPAIR